MGLNVALIQAVAIGHSVVAATALLLLLGALFKQLRVSAAVRRFLRTIERASAAMAARKLPDQLLRDVAHRYGLGDLVGQQAVEDFQAQFDRSNREMAAASGRGGGGGSGGGGVGGGGGGGGGGGEQGGVVFKAPDDEKYATLANVPDLAPKGPQQPQFKAADDEQYATLNVVAGRDVFDKTAAQPAAAPAGPVFRAADDANYATLQIVPQGVFDKK